MIEIPLWLVISAGVGLLVVGCGILIILLQMKDTLEFIHVHIKYPLFSWEKPQERMTASETVAKMRKECK